MAVDTTALIAAATVAVRVTRRRMPVRAATATQAPDRAAASSVAEIPAVAVAILAAEGETVGVARRSDSFTC
jgi:hypothetical protein